MAIIYPTNETYIHTMDMAVVDGFRGGTPREIPVFLVGISNTTQTSQGIYIVEGHSYWSSISTSGCLVVQES